MPISAFKSNWSLGSVVANNAEKGNMQQASFLSEP